MDYREAMEFLEETKKYGSILGLQSIRNLMACLGNVQDQVPMVHIGGTNGKGSVGAMLSSVFAEAGYRVGRFNTPDVFSYEEEFLMNGEPIGKERLAAVFTKVAEACNRLVKAGQPHPTRFEVETAAAFLWFCEEKCDIALVEVGMGGETDATNIIKRPLVSVLTSISMDHMKFLGNNPEEIARVKAGIIKEGCPVVTAAQSPEVMRVIESRCREKNTFYVCASGEKSGNGAESKRVKDMVMQPDGTAAFAWNPGSSWIFRGDPACPENNRKSRNDTTCSENAGKFRNDPACPEHTEWISIQTGLRGTFQMENALCALEALRILQKDYPLVTERAVREGLAKTRWPGRLEPIGSAPDFYLDGSHNEGAVKMLRETLDIIYPDRRIIYIMGVLADKDYGKMIQTMFHQGDRVFTVTPQNPRALDGRELAGQLVRQNIDAFYCENVKDAVLYALREARETDVILAFGSLSYLQEIRAAYEDEICR